MNKEFIFNLSEPISIDKDGKAEMGTELLVRGPRPTDTIEASILESEFMSSMVTAGKQYSDISIEETTVKKGEVKDVSKEEMGKQYLMGMSVGKANFQVCFNCLLILFTGRGEPPPCEVQGIRLTKPLFDKIGYEDKKQLLGVYVAYFLSSSLSN